MRSEVRYWRYSSNSFLWRVDLVSSFLCFRQYCNISLCLSLVTSPSKRTGPDGNGVRPLQELSNFLVSSETCDARIDEGQPPGTLMLVKMKHGPKGSDNTMVSTIKVGMGCAKSTYLRNHTFRSPLAPAKARPCCNLAPKLRDHCGYALTFEQLHLPTFQSIQMTGE